MVTVRQPSHAIAAQLSGNVFVAGLTVYLIVAFKLSLHWPLVGDAQVMHYIVFLIQHGFTPYRQIYDMNMPGCYLFEGVGLALFGTTDFGWRLYDLSLLLAAGASMVVIARRYDWRAGFAAGAILTLTHLAEGPAVAGERDLVMAVLLLFSSACLFESVRQSTPWLMLPFAFASAMSASIKPTTLVAGPILLLLACLQLRRSGSAVRRYCLYAGGGWLLAAGVVVAFLLRTNAYGPLWYTLTKVLPGYGASHRLLLGLLLAETMPPRMTALVALGLLGAALRASRQTWEEWSLLFLAALGALHFFVQGKGWHHHRYILLAFLLLWILMQLLPAPSRQPKQVFLTLAALACCLLYLCPQDIHRARAFPQVNGFTTSLERDLIPLGVDRLQHQVQCLDIIEGCLASLFHLQIVQSNGATGDLSLFQPEPSAVADASRQMFWSLVHTHPPAVYVFTNGQLALPTRGFDQKLRTWPRFADYLRSEYVLVQQRAFRRSVEVPSPLGQDEGEIAYRIYIRRDSPLLSSFHPIPARPSNGIQIP